MLRENDLRLPPFGKVIAAYQEEKIQLDFPIYIFVGDHAKDEAYLHKKIGTLCCYLPYQEEVANYRWPITNQKVLIQDTGGIKVTEIKIIAFYLLTNYNPRSLVIVSTNSSFGEIPIDNVIQCK